MLHRFLLRPMSRSPRSISPSRLLLTQTGPQSVSLRFIATDSSQKQVESSVLDRYRAKLEQKAKESGKDVEALRKEAKELLKERQPEKIEDPLVIESAARAKLAAERQRLQETTSSESTSTEGGVSQSSSAGQGAAKTTTSSAATPPGIRPLSSYIDVEKVRDLPAEEVSKIWVARHAGNPSSLSAVIRASTWETMYRLARENPMFILPLPVKKVADTGASSESDQLAIAPGEGAEIHLVQWTFPSATTATVLFTRLAEYQLRHEYASPHTTLTHHTDLLESHSIVLANGEVADPARTLTTPEAQLLVMCLQKFYSGRTETGRKLLESFTKGDPNFKVEAVLEEIERLD